MKSRQTVLIVEDDLITLEIVALHFVRAGFLPRLAVDGAEALSILRSGSAAIDWLFTDIRLPGGISGWTIGDEFRLSHPFRPVIYASSNPGDASRVVANSVFVAKPYSASQIVDAFRALSSAGQVGAYG